MSDFFFYKYITKSKKKICSREICLHVTYCCQFSNYQEKDIFSFAICSSVILFGTIRAGKHLKFHASHEAV